MLIGKVKGSVVSTRKCERLVGNKFTIVEVLKQHVQTGGADQIIAIDKMVPELETTYWWHREVQPE